MVGFVIAKNVAGSLDRFKVAQGILLDLLKGPMKGLVGLNFNLR